MKKRNTLIVLLALAVVINAAGVWAGQSSANSGDKKMSYLDNGTIRLGVNLNLGGSITYLAVLRRAASSHRKHGRASAGIPSNRAITPATARA